MSGYCPDCGNTVCICKEVAAQENAPSFCTVDSIVGRDCHKETRPSEVRSDALLGDLLAVEDIAYNAPELNMCNYNHDDVANLNAAMCEIYDILRKYHDTPNKEITRKDASCE